MLQRVQVLCCISLDEWEVIKYDLTQEKVLCDGLLELLTISE